MFAPRQKYKDEGKDLLQNLVEIFMNNLYGVQIGKIVNESYKCKSQISMEIEYGGNVLDYWNLPNGNYIVKFKKDDGLEGDNDVKNTLPSHLRAIILVTANEL